MNAIHAEKFTWVLNLAVETKGKQGLPAGFLFKIFRTICYSKMEEIIFLRILVSVVL